MKKIIFLFAALIHPAFAAAPETYLEEEFETHGCQQRSIKEIYETVTHEKLKPAQAPPQILLGNGQAASELFLIEGRLLRSRVHKGKNVMKWISGNHSQKLFRVAQETPGFGCRDLLKKGKNRWKSESIPGNWPGNFLRVSPLVP